MILYGRRTSTLNFGGTGSDLTGSKVAASDNGKFVGRLKCLRLARDVKHLRVDIEYVSICFYVYVHTVTCTILI